MIDLSHLHALELGLSHERERLRKARTEREREMRAVWVAGYEKEIAAERTFLGLEPETAPDPNLTLDEILAELEDNQ